MSVTVVVPTYNGGGLWRQSAQLLAEQFPKPDRVKVIDSTSIDDSALTASQLGFDVIQIAQSDFDHGGTRSFALEDIKTDFVVFLTQDALLENQQSIAKLTAIFGTDKKIVCAYGCQLPHVDANPLAEYARFNSYSQSSYITSLSDNYPIGFRKAFLSNSFAAYRMEFLRSIGGFPQSLILGEDSFVAAKVLLAQKKVAYVAHAKVRHSHNYKITEEFKRYFDIGVFHSTQGWMIDELGPVEGEGVKFALGQLVYLLKRKKLMWLVPSFFASLAKYIGYKLGRKHQKIGPNLSRKLSMYKSYWNRQN